MSEPPVHSLPQPACRALSRKPAGVVVRRDGRLLLGVLSGLLSMVCVQLGSAWSVPAMREQGPYALTWLRLCCAALALLAWARPPLWRLLRAHGGQLAALGAAMAGMMLCFFAAIRSMPLGLTVAINFLGPLLVALAGAGRRLALAWPPLAFLGVGLLAWHGGQWQGDAAGLAFACGAAVCWGAYILLMKRVGRLGGGLDGLAASMLMAALWCAPFGLAGLHGRPLPDLPQTAVLALLTPLLPYVLEMLALRRMPAASFGILASLEPAIAALAGWLLLAQPVAPAQLLGVALVVGASLGSLLTAR
ncbi:EamA family transporter [Chromobacterium subtsugae]|nr:EamA family transporter [Chromobacterium subtsugae]WSE90418.1 EamA family transporter [Chromobacterium subtsugae]